MIDQKNPRLAGQIQEAGCNLLCHVRILELTEGVDVEFSVDDINDALLNWREAGLNAECGVLNPEKLGWFLLKNKIVLGFNLPVKRKRLAQVGSGGRTWGGRPIQKCAGTITHYKTSYAPYFSHYILTDLAGENIIYDPMRGRLSMDSVVNRYHYSVT